MTVFTIPSTLLPVGPRTFGPMAITAAQSTFTLTVDRTPTTGLNAQPATTTISILFQFSADGSTWTDLASCTGIQGGIYSNPLAGQKNSDVFSSSIWYQGTTGRSVRATVTIAGSTVRVAGSLTVT